MTDPEDPIDRQRRTVGTGRMEAFSDGVFAIAITLLVLDLIAPPLEGGVGRGLLDQWPRYFAYLVSFATVGAAWIAHTGSPATPPRGWIPDLTAADVCLYATRRLVSLFAA